MQGTIKNDVRRRIHIRIHTKRFDHFYCKKWEILRAAIIGILLLACREIPLHNMTTGITFAEKQKNDNYYEKESVCFSVALLFDIGSS